MEALHREIVQIDSTSAEKECDIDLSEVETMSFDIEQPQQGQLPPVLPLVQEAPTATAAPSMNGHNEALARYLATLLASIPRGLRLALVIFVFSVIAQMYPTAPQSGCYIALLLALFHIKPVSWQDKGGKLHLVSLVGSIGITIILDIDWLISNYFLESLGENDDFEYKLKQETSFVWQMAWWAVAINLFVYLMALNDYLNVWSHIRGYIVSNMKDVPKSVSQKVILVTWIDLISSILILIYFFLIVERLKLVGVVL